MPSSTQTSGTRTSRPTAGLLKLSHGSDRGGEAQAQRCWPRRSTRREGGGETATYVCISHQHTLSTCTRTSIHPHVSEYTHTDVMCVYTLTHLYACVHMHKHIWLHTCAHLRVHARTSCIYKYTNIPMHTYPHPPTHTHRQNGVDLHGARCMSLTAPYWNKGRYTLVRTRGHMATCERTCCWGHKRRWVGSPHGN